MCRTVCTKDFWAKRYARKTFGTDFWAKGYARKTFGLSALHERLLGQALCTKDFWATDLEEILEDFAANRYFFAVDRYERKLHLLNRRLPAISFAVDRQVGDYTFSAGGWPPCECGVGIGKTMWEGVVWGGRNCGNNFSETF